MKKQHLKPLILLGCLITLTCTAMAYATRTPRAGIPDPVQLPASNGIVKLSGQLTQSKVFTGGNGDVSLAITLTADETNETYSSEPRNVDLVIVLDRSGSMQGRKLSDAARAISGLVEMLGDRDRLALISYSDGVMRHSDLMPADRGNKIVMKSAVHSIRAGGGTNLGEGLREGISILTNARKIGNQGRIILISDGLANQGVTHPGALGDMAATAVSGEFAVSTVGVGNDFNEYLMTSLADRGTGSYYYLENPGAFAEVFQKEFTRTRTAAATGVELSVPLPGGVSLVHAAGYPIEIINNKAVFRPGDLMPGQARKLYLTFRVPTNIEQEFDISGITARYAHNNDSFSATLDSSFRVACVNDRKAVIASIDKDEWEDKLMREDMNVLREKVARDIQSGRKNDALSSIEEFKAAQKSVRESAGYAGPAPALEQEIGSLQSVVSETFAGKPEAVTAKQKKNAKELQYRSYEGRRSME